MSSAESSSPKSTEAPVIDVEPFGYELPSGLSLRVEDKAEWLRRNEGFSVFSKRIYFYLQ
jgi:hypothetical protein